MRKRRILAHFFCSLLKLSLARSLLSSNFLSLQLSPKLTWIRRHPRSPRLWRRRRSSACSGTTTTSSPSSFSLRPRRGHRHSARDGGFVELHVEVVVAVVSRAVGCRPSSSSIVRSSCAARPRVVEHDLEIVVLGLFVVLLLLLRRRRRRSSSSSLVIAELGGSRGALSKRRNGSRLLLLLRNRSSGGNSRGRAIGRRRRGRCRCRSRGLCFSRSRSCRSCRCSRFLGLGLFLLLLLLLGGLLSVELRVGFGVERRKGFSRLSVCVDDFDEISRFRRRFLASRRPGCSNRSTGRLLRVKSHLLPEVFVVSHRVRRMKSGAPGASFVVFCFFRSMRQARLVVLLRTRCCVERHRCDACAKRGQALGQRCPGGREAARTGCVKERERKPALAIQCGGIAARSRVFFFFSCRCPAAAQPPHSSSSPLALEKKSSSPPFENQRAAPPLFSERRRFFRPSFFAARTCTFACSSPARARDRRVPFLSRERAQRSTFGRPSSAAVFFYYFSSSSSSSFARAKDEKNKTRPKHSMATAIDPTTSLQTGYATLQSLWGRVEGQR